MSLKSEAFAFSMKNIESSFKRWKTMSIDGNSTSIVLIKEHFDTLKDPRAQHKVDHLLIDIIVITICATICGANDWFAIAAYGVSKYE